MSTKNKANTFNRVILNEVRQELEGSGQFPAAFWGKVDGIDRKMLKRRLPMLATSTSKGPRYWAGLCEGKGHVVISVVERTAKQANLICESQVSISKKNFSRMDPEIFFITEIVKLCKNIPVEAFAWVPAKFKHSILKVNELLTGWNVPVAPVEFSECKRVAARFDWGFGLEQWRMSIAAAIVADPRKIIHRRSDPCFAVGSKQSGLVLEEEAKFVGSILRINPKSRD